MTDLKAKLNSILSGEYFPRLGFVEPAIYGKDAFETALSEDGIFADVAESGLDMLIGAKYDLRENRAAVIKTLEMCEKAGLLYLVRDSESFSDRTREQAEKYFVTEYKELCKFASFAGVSPVDEPGYVSWDKAKKFRRAFNKVFPDKLYYINLLQNYAPDWAITNGAGREDDLPGDGDYDFYCKSYVRQADPPLFCYDFYPFREEYPRVKSGYFEQLETALKYAGEKDLPIWCFLQSASFPEMSGFARAPSYEEMLWQANTSLCYGTKGLAHFCYWMPYDDENWTNAFVDVHGNKTQTYFNAQRLNGYLRSVGGYFTESKVCKVIRQNGTFDVSPFPAVKSVEGDAVTSCMLSGGSERVFIVNGSFEKSVSVTVELSDGISSAFDLFSDAEPTINGNRLTLVLGRGEGKLIALKR